MAAACLLSCAQYSSPQICIVHQSISQACISADFSFVPIVATCPCSLALMGTDYGAFLIEASRVLKAGGWLWVAEVGARLWGRGFGEQQ